MSWFSSIIKTVTNAVTSVGHDVEKNIIRPIAPQLITGAAVAGLGAITGGAAFGSASILADSGLLGGSHSGQGGVSPIMGLTAGQLEGQAAVDSGLAVGTAIGNAQGAVQGVVQGITSETVNLAVKYGIFIVLILFMLAAFFALLMPDEEQIINVAGKVASTGAE